MSAPDDKPDRRKFLTQASRAAMAGGLVASYGTCATYSARFLYPQGPRAKAWQYVAEVSRLAPGESLTYRSPTGEHVAIARRADTGAVGDFVALSSTCPHLGCQVHWEAANKRFFCPCHNGTFDAEGKAISGPPAEGGRNLSQYPLRVDGGLLYIEVPMPDEAVASAEACGEVLDRAPDGPPGPGHDPCLYAVRRKEA